MLKNIFYTYVDAVSDDSDVCVVVRSIETGEEIATTYDVVVDISEYGELMIGISIEQQPYVCYRCSNALSSI